MKQRKGKRDSKSSATVLRRYTAAARSESTRVAYTKDIEKFRRWGGRVPSTPNVVARYLAEHAEISASASLGRMLAAINYAHRQKGVTSPTHSELVRATLMGIRRTHRRPQRQAAPLLQRDLRRRVAHSAGLRGGAPCRPYLAQAIDGMGHALIWPSQGVRPVIGAICAALKAG